MSDRFAHVRELFEQNLADGDALLADAQMTSSEVLDMSVLDDLADYGITLDAMPHTSI